MSRRKKRERKERKKMVDDDLSKRKEVFGRPYIDLVNEEEDTQIKVMAEAVLHLGKTIACIVDNEPGKPERYIKKMKAHAPSVRVIYQSVGPTPALYTIKFAPPEVPQHSQN